MGVSSSKAWTVRISYEEDGGRRAPGGLVGKPVSEPVSDPVPAGTDGAVVPPARQQGPSLVSPSRVGEGAAASQSRRPCAWTSPGTGVGCVRFTRPTGAVRGREAA